ncbi:MAG: PAS domain-containing protein [Bacteroidetes bacterium]|nr:PAS domain-containing protein [Bacteroidota bacterium]
MYNVYIRIMALIKRFWDNISYAGIFAAKTDWERKNIIHINRAWLILMFVQLISVTSHIANGLERSAWLTFILILGLIGVHLIIRMGKLNAGKMTAILVINYSMVLMGVFLGSQTQLIDFLLLSAMMPLYLFETNNKKLIFWGMFLSVAPFGLYHLFIPGFESYALSYEEQIAIYKVTSPIKLLSLVTLLYLIYNKNADYEEEVKHKERELIGQKRLYECMLEQIPIAIASFDKELKYTYLNSSAVKDMSLRKWMMGKTDMDYFKEYNLDIRAAEERTRVLHEALEKECEIQLEETVLDRSGKVRHSLKGTAPIYSDDNKELLCLIGYSLDISNIKEAERKIADYAVELERKNSDLQHFVNATSHDLKTPLRVVASYLQLLERKNKGKLDEDSLSMIASTIKSVKQLNQLISDIYQYSVADSTEKPVEVTDLMKLANDTINQIGAVVRQKNAVVQLKQLPTLKLAPSHAGMLFANLIENAIKYNESEAPEVTIACETTDQEYIVSVKDNGIGIPEAYKKQVFEIFRRLHNSDTYEGTGVG